MIKEVSLLNLLNEEDMAVKDYNIAMSCIDTAMKYCNERLKESPESQESIKRFYQKDVSVQLKKKCEAEQKIKEVRGQIKEYFSKL